MSNAQKISDSQITPPEIYFNRRNFMRGATLVATVATTGAAYRAEQHGDSVFQHESVSQHVDSDKQHVDSGYRIARASGPDQTNWRPSRQRRGRIPSGRVHDTRTGYHPL